jgi:hypothetical protein
MLASSGDLDWQTLASLSLLLCAGTCAEKASILECLVHDGPSPSLVMKDDPNFLEIVHKLCYLSVIWIPQAAEIA